MSIIEKSPTYNTPQEDIQEQTHRFLHSAVLAVEQGDKDTALAMVCKAMFNVDAFGRKMGDNS